MKKQSREAIEAFLADHGATKLPRDPLIDLLEAEGLQQIDGGVTARATIGSTGRNPARRQAFQPAGYQVLTW